MSSSPGISILLNRQNIYTSAAKSGCNRMIDRFVDVNFQAHGNFPIAEASLLSATGRLRPAFFNSL